MGWLWKSSPASSNDDSAKASTVATPPAPISTSENAQSSASSSAPFGLTEAQRMRIFGRPSAVPPASNTPDEHTDAEVESFFKSLETSDGSKALPQDRPAAPGSQPKTSIAPVKEAPRAIDRVRPDGSLDISPDVMYPRTMSCWEHFDEFMYCQTFGGSFTGYYRYGEMQSCKEQLSAWMFCMRTRMQEEESKQVQIRDFWAAREEDRKKKFGSSEDVWEVRETAVKKAFWRPHPD